VDSLVDNIAEAFQGNTKREGEENSADAQESIPHHGFINLGEVDILQDKLLASLEVKANRLHRGEVSAFVTDLRQYLDDRLHGGSL